MILMIGRNDPCWCGSGKKWKKCHYPKLPAGPLLAKRYLTDFGIVLKTSDQIEKIKIACKVTAKILVERWCDGKAAYAYSSLILAGMSVGGIYSHWMALRKQTSNE